MPAGISAIDISTGLVVTTFGVTIQFNGIHGGHIWIPSPYSNRVEGENLELCDSKNVVIIIKVTDVWLCGPDFVICEGTHLALGDSKKIAIILHVMEAWLCGRCCITTVNNTVSCTINGH